MATLTLPPPSLFNAELSQCWEALQGGRTIAVYRCLIEITGSLKAAAMLSQLLYWTRVSKEVAQRDGWIYKSISQMQEETGLTPREQDTCKDKLKKLNLIQTRRKGVGAPLALKVNLDELSAAVCMNGGNSGNVGLTLDELQNRSSLFYRRYFSKRIAYHRDLVTLTGCIHAAVMLTCALQDAVNQLNTHKHHAFSSLTAAEWQERIVLSDKSQRTARNRLKDLKFIFEKHFLASRRIFTLVNGRAILETIRNLLNAPVQESRSKLSEKAEFRRLAERAKKDWRKGPNMDEQGFQADLPENIPHSENMTFRIDKREDSESTNGEIKKPQNRKFISDKWAVSESTNGQIVIYLNYKGVFNYNYKTVLPNKTVKPDEKVVVVDSSDLIYPKTFNATMKAQATQLFSRFCPNIDHQQMQEILDEIAGQKQVNSPLGLLMTFCRLAGQGEFTAMVAHKVREARIAMARNREQQEKAALAKSVSGNSEKNQMSVEELRASTLAAVKKRKPYSK